MAEQYQLFGKLRDEEYKALEADIVKRGVMVPIEVDAKGAILDGHHRKKIADKHNLKYKTIKRYFKTEAEKREHVIKLNMARRHLAPHEWGQAFKVLLESKGVKRGSGKGNPKAQESKADTVSALAKDTGVDERTARRRLAAADKYDKLPKAAQKAVDAGTATLAEAIRETKRKKIVADLDDIATRKTKKAAGLYDVIVIDPPWPMKKIERDCRPNQSELDYPTMTEQQLTKLKIPSAANCHVWVWATHRFLPMAFRLLEVWGLKYVCCFTWHKPGGYQAVGLPQFNSEFCLYARKGTPAFISTKQFSTCFTGKRTGHSIKPSEFYDMVRRVTGGRRLDIFNRRHIDGFDGWGKEA